jgi:phosphoribosylformimino-5-aminoimidazole carboxamide ribotide isomerase
MKMHRNVVDLDAAFSGIPQNQRSIRAIVAQASGRVEVGGGLRSLDTIGQVLDLGVDRVVLGTAAVNDPDLISAALRRWGPEKIVIGLDAKEDKIAIQGWVETSIQTPLALAREMQKRGIIRIIYTDISRDGTLAGPNVKSVQDLAAQTGLHVVASGGISSLADLEKIRDQAPEVEAVIVGKALYENKFSIEQAIAVFK